MNKLAELTDRLPPELTLYTYSPGDGAVRYRLAQAGGSYFEAREIFTAIGRREAAAMILAFLAGIRYQA